MHHHCHDAERHQPVRMVVVASLLVLVVVDAMTTTSSLVAGRRRWWCPGGRRAACDWLRGRGAGAATASLPRPRSLSKNRTRQRARHRLPVARQCVGRPRPIRQTRARAPPSSSRARTLSRPAKQSKIRSKQHSHAPILSGAGCGWLLHSGCALRARPARQPCKKINKNIFFVQNE